MIEERAHLLAAGGAGLRAGGGLLPARGWSGMRAGADQFVFGSGQARQNGRGAALPELTWKCGMKAAASPGTSAATDVSSRCSIWSTTSTCWSASRARWPDPSRSRHGAHRGLWPQSYDRLLEELIGRHGKQSGTRQMIQVLSLIKQHGHERVRAAVEEAVTLGCSDAAAIRHLAAAADLSRMRAARSSSWASLSRFERPLPVMTDYDAAARPGGGAMSAHSRRPGSGHHPAAVQGIASADRRGAERPTR